MSEAAPFQRVAVVGLGVMGGSFARALTGIAAAPEVRGWSHDADERRAALYAGAVMAAPEDLKEALQEADLVAIATPLQAACRLIADIAAARLARDRTGQTSEVDVSLLGLGMWAMGLPIAATLGREDPWIAPPTGLTAAPTNPTAGVYETSDGRLLSLMMLQGYRYWADFCRHIDRPDLISDVRFADAESLAENAGEAETILREVLAGRTLAEWTERFRTLEGQWAPVQNTHEVAADPQARANGYITEVSAGDGTFEVVASPVQFDHESPTLQAAPEFAADTEAVLLELGFEWDRIMELKGAGAIT